MMNTESKSTESLTILEGTDETEQAYEGVVIQEAPLFFPFDEAVLEALLEVGGLRHAYSARRPRGEPMQCNVCRDKTDERCSYCLLPVCEEHGGQVQLWFTSRHMMVCTLCQERLREVAWEEQSL